MPYHPGRTCVSPGTALAGPRAVPDRPGCTDCFYTTQYITCIICYMPRPNRALPSLPRPATDTRGITPRAIKSSDVDRAADALLRAGQRPTVEKVRATIGRGSPNTVNPLLDAWWKRLAGRLDAGPAALHRLPEPVLLAAEGLWLQALEDARTRAAAEQGSRKASLAREKQDLEVRSHVLSIRESEITDRLKESERRVGRLEIELETLTTMLRKEQASRAAAQRRLSELPEHAVRRGRARKPTAKASTAAKSRQKRRKRATKPSPAKPTAQRKVTIKTRSRQR